MKSFLCGFSVILDLCIVRLLNDCMFACCSKGVPDLHLCYVSFGIMPPAVCRASWCSVPLPPDGLSLPSGKPTASRPQQRKLQGETNHKTSRVHGQLGLGNPGSGMPGSFWTAYIITRCPDLREIQKAIRRILSLAKRWKVYPKYNEVGYSSLELCTDSNSRQER